MTFQKSDYLDERGNSIPRSSENPVGHLVKVALVKSKVCKLDRKVGFYTLKYLDGIDYISDIIDLAIKAGLIHAAGAWYSILDDEGNVAQNEGFGLKFQGKAKLHQFLSEHPDWTEELNEQVLKHFS